MPQLYPLTFEPLYRQYIWGGRRLASELGKELGDGDRFAESWEIVDHGGDQSIVSQGPLQGTTLTELCEQHGAELFGRHHPQPTFPLLLKFLDANRDLSVQVHPNDQQAAKLEPPDRGKTEAWVILQADPGSVVYAGLKRGFDRAAFEREVRRGTGELCLNRFEPQVGDCLFIPAGTVHALGAGLLVAEIQQSSDTTFRVSDWNRVGADGKPRPLHVEQALEVIDFERGPVQPQVPQQVAGSAAERLVECPYFVLDRWRVSDSFTLGGDDRFHAVVLLDGEVSFDGGSGKLTKGQTMLLPAACGGLSLSPASNCELLEIFLPD